MDKEKQILLSRIGNPESHTLEAYEGAGGYSTIRKVLERDPLEVIEEVKKSGLRGRGGAGFPTGMKWGFVPRDSGRSVYLLNNADEGEPGTFKDRVLLERDPHLCLEGMMIAAWALQAHWSCIYIRGEYTFPYSRINGALKECYEKGYLGDDIFGSGYKLDIVIHRGAGAYICGEETALIESLEGKKGQPRLKPPFPAVVGVYGCPTVVNNTETLATLPWILEHGGEEYAKRGTAKSTGTRLMAASGHIENPGVYEIEMGYPLPDFLNNECGGVREGHELKAIIPGGSSVPVLRADELEGITLDFESLKDAGSLAGSGAFIVLDDSTDMVEVALNLARFYTDESCGQCTPCREGGHWIEKIMERIACGRGDERDLELIESLCGQIGGHTICAFGEALVTPPRSIMKKFPEEFAARISRPKIAEENMGGGLA